MYLQLPISAAPYFTQLSNIIRDKRSTKHFKGIKYNRNNIEYLPEPQTPIYYLKLIPIH